MDICQILSEGDFATWEQLAERIVEKHEVKILQQPDTSLVMMQSIDSVGLTPFCLGEVLITEAVVTVDGASGYGFVLEDDPARALCFAIIDGALAAQVEEENEILSIISFEAERINQQEQQQKELVAGTKVRFAIMEG